MNRLWLALLRRLRQLITTPHERRMPMAWSQLRAYPVFAAADVDGEGCG